MGFVVELLEVDTCVFSCLGDEDGPLSGIVDVGVHELFMCGALDGADQCFVGTMCAKRCAQRFEEEGGCVPLACECGLEVV